LLIPFPLNKNEEKNKGKQNKQKHTKKCGKKAVKTCNRSYKRDKARSWQVVIGWQKK